MVLAITIKSKINKRIGNDFFAIMLIFWSGVLVIAVKPDLLDSTLNNTGLVNRAQFLLSFSIILILYLLVYQIRKNKITSNNLNHIIRKIALDYFVKELENMKRDDVDVIIVIVAKDEEKTIGKVIDSIKSQKFLFSYKIILVNDGSTDSTEKIARDKNILVVTHHYNLGVGAANKTGYLASRHLESKFIINMDADGQHDPSYIGSLVKKLEEGYDLVYGTRFGKLSDYQTNTIRLVGNKFYTNLVNKIGKLSITDVTSGYRAIRTEKINSIYYYAETNFAIELALRAAKNKLKITEIPTKTMKRVHGQSQFHKIEKFITYNMNALIQILNAYLKNPKILDIEK